MIHDLKTWPEYFEEVLSENKPFEVRLNDRDYKVGDVLNLREWENVYSGRVVSVLVTYVLSDERFVKPGYVVMGIKQI